MRPNPDDIYPQKGCEVMCNVKPTITNPNIIVGDFTYFTGSNFQEHVTHHYDFVGDKLIIGKFCMLGKGIEFVMNGANHQMNASTLYPFYIFDNWDMKAPKEEDMPLKGDTVIGNDVYIGQNCTILPGVHIGDGAIIGLNSTVGKDIPPYAVAVGNPVRIIKKRFDDEMIDLLLKLKWWDKDIDEIKRLIPILTSSDLDMVKAFIKEYLEKDKK